MEIPGKRVLIRAAKTEIPVNTRRLLQPIGYIPPAEYEERYYEQATVA